MSESKIEERILTLEQQMREVIQKIQSTPLQNSETKDWRKSLGMFNEHPVMKQIDENGRRIRQDDREQGAA